PLLPEQPLLWFPPETRKPEQGLLWFPGRKPEQSIARADALVSGSLPETRAGGLVSGGNQSAGSEGGDGSRPSLPFSPKMGLFSVVNGNQFPLTTFSGCSQTPKARKMISGNHFPGFQTHPKHKPQCKV
ncbi:hypothetical protein ABN262_23545, partial [Citrobacter youngae]|uniref:hypothetical protein n=1 Tax=Citrobacter youngae TaxID=133448 RepID=UPI0032D9B3B1